MFSFSFTCVLLQGESPRRKTVQDFFGLSFGTEAGVTVNQQGESILFYTDWNVSQAWTSHLCPIRSTFVGLLFGCLRQWGTVSGRPVKGKGSRFWWLIILEESFSNPRWQILSLLRHEAEAAWRCLHRPAAWILQPSQQQAKSDRWRQQNKEKVFSLKMSSILIISAYSTFKPI